MKSEDFISLNLCHKKKNSFAITVHSSLGWLGSGDLLSDVLAIRNYNGGETWALTGSQRLRLAVEQRKMARKILGISLHHHWSNERVMVASKLTPVNKAVIYQKWNFARKLTQFNKDSPTLNILSWRPYNCRRNPGRPRIRWKDEFTQYTGEAWMRTAREDPDTWRRLRLRQVADSTV